MHKKIKIATIIIIIAFTLSSIPTSLLAKSLGVKWHNIPKTVYVNVDPLTTSGENAAVNAMNTWDTVRDLNNSTMVTLTRTTGTSLNKVQYGYPGIGIVAATYSATNGDEITSFVIKLNTTDYNFCVGLVSGCYDYETIILHELGHALGIAHCHEKDHEPCFSQTCSQNVMNPYAYTYHTNRSFQFYDTASYIVIYW